MPILSLIFFLHKGKKSECKIRNILGFWLNLCSMIKFQLNSQRREVVPLFRKISQSFFQKNNLSIPLPSGSALCHRSESFSRRFTLMMVADDGMFGQRRMFGPKPSQSLRKIKQINHPLPRGRCWTLNDNELITFSEQNAKKKNQQITAKKWIKEVVQRTVNNKKQSYLGKFIHVPKFLWLSRFVGIRLSLLGFVGVCWWWCLFINLKEIIQGL